jgi:LysM repeat protein
MQRKSYFTLLFLLIIGVNLFAQKSSDVLDYINTYKELAISEMKRTGIPAAIKIAQGIHETMAGQSDLVKKSNNHFGIKCKSNWVGEKVYHDDDALGECFRSYPTAIDSYMDHSDFLKNSPRYSFLFQIDPTDFESWAYGLKKAGYATNIRYSQLLIKLIRDYNLQDYTLIALGRIKDDPDFLASNKNANTHKLESPGINFADRIDEVEKEKLYPSGAFQINNTKVIYVKANTALLSVAEEFDVPLTRLLDFNDLQKDNEILSKGQLVFLQRKRKTGSSEFHILKSGESLYEVSQAEGIRFESLLQYNHLSHDMQPAEGEKLYLQSAGPSRPLLVEKNNMLQGNSFASYIDSQRRPEFITHIVTPKETLYSISKKYGVEVEKIIDWNKLDNLNVKIGQQLMLIKPETNSN